MRPRFVLLFIALFAIPALAQFPKPDMNRARTYDVQNYVIRVSFDRPNKKVIGDTTVQLKPLKPGFTQTELDAVGLKFDSVTLDPSGAELKYRTTSDKVIVTLDKAYSPDDVISIRFKYATTAPRKGVYFVDETRENGDNVPYQIWTQGEAEEARYWFPSFDFPSDKATSEEFITAEKGQTVIANGEELDRKDNADGTVTHHFKMSIPYSTYLTSFVIGTYVKQTDSHGSIPLGFYVYPGKESIVPVAFSRTKDMMQAFEEVTGVPFPYNKYDQSIVRNFNFGGMENITATTLADTEVFFANFDFGKATVQDLVSHELSHSWFGAEENAGLKLSVEGHTDNIGSEEQNQKLSQERAAAIIAAVTAQGIAAERLSPTGFGATKPIAPNDTSEGRAKNRRVELAIYASKELREKAQRQARS